jgi:hypothetical protein
MRNTPKSLNEELMKMRKLMNFDISENSHDVLSENFVSEQRKIKFGWTKPITIKKGKSSNDSMKQGDFKPSIEQEKWDIFLGEDSLLVNLMSKKSKVIWGKMKTSVDPEAKGFAVAVLEYFNKTNPSNKWERVWLGEEVNKVPSTEEELYPSGKYEFPASLPSSKDFFEDNKWETTDVFKNAFKTEILDHILGATNGVTECKDGSPMLYVNSIIVKSSASRFRNGIEMSWLDLSKNRNSAALTYIKESLENIGALIDGDTKVSQNYKGGNGDGSSGPNPGYVVKNGKTVGYTLSTDGSKNNTISNPSKEDRNKYGEVLKSKEDYDKFKYLSAVIDISINRCTDPDKKKDDSFIELENYKVRFSATEGGLKIKFPKIFLIGSKKTKFKPYKGKCPKFDSQKFLNRKRK